MRLVVMAKTSFHETNVRLERAGGKDADHGRLSQAEAIHVIVQTGAPFHIPA
ncbi:MAG TPA: hypothetical protein VFP80_00150 [Thermoanaerobaculia bacterium]|nr:hypothetical protein [Thermoanaerobaculia bacterium]